MPVTIPPAFVAYLLLVAAMVYDWRTSRRPHPVYVYGGIALIAIKLLNWPISVTARRRRSGRHPGDRAVARDGSPPPANYLRKTAVYRCD